jgi:hypothetical protein
MKAFLASLVLLVAIAAVAAIALQSVDMSSSTVYQQPSSVRL